MRDGWLTTEQLIRFIKQANFGMAVAELGRQQCFGPAVGRHAGEASKQPVWPS